MADLEKIYNKDFLSIVVGLSKDDIHTIKDGIGAGPKDWTGISPDGDVISGDADGNQVNNGPYGDYLPHNRCP